VLTRGWLKERTILKVEALYFFKKFKKQKKIASFTVDWLYFAFKKKVLRLALSPPLLLQ